MLTVRLRPARPASRDLLLDLGCGFGRHAFEAFRRGARVVACDYGAAELEQTCDALFEAMARRRRGARPTAWRCTASTATPRGCRSRTTPSTGSSPRGDGAHPRRRGRARRAGPGAEARRHDRRHVPAWLPEKVCWTLSDEYHAPFVRRRPRAHLHRARAALEDARRRARARCGPPRPRAAHARTGG